MKAITFIIKKMPSHGKSVADLLWDVAVIGIAEVGLDGSWKRVNPAICKMLEYTQAELESMTFQDITHPGDVSDHQDMAQKLIIGDLDSYVMTKRYITKTGKVIWVKLNVDSVLSDEGDVLFFLSQISPVYEIENSTDAIDDKSGRNTINISNDIRIVRFFKKEWKWIIAAILGSTLAFAKYYHEEQTYKEIQQQQSKRLLELEKEISILEKASLTLNTDE